MPAFLKNLDVLQASVGIVAVIMAIGIVVDAVADGGRDIQAILAAGGTIIGLIVAQMVKGAHAENVSNQEKIASRVGASLDDKK